MPDHNRDDGLERTLERRELPRQLSLLHEGRGVGVAEIGHGLTESVREAVSARSFERHGREVFARTIDQSVHEAAKSFAETPTLCSRQEFYRLVPVGSNPSHSPYGMPRSEAEYLAAHPEEITSRLGLPRLSEERARAKGGWQLHRFTATNPDGGQGLSGRIAPTSDFEREHDGRGLQFYVLDKTEWKLQEDAVQSIAFVEPRPHG